MILFIPLPQPDSVLHADLNSILSNFLLMKLGGQVTLSMSDLRELARAYAGYSVVYEMDSSSFVLKLKTRPDEYPAPELHEIAS